MAPSHTATHHRNQKCIVISDEINCTRCTKQTIYETLSHQQTTTTATPHTHTKPVLCAPVCLQLHHHYSQVVSSLCFTGAVISRQHAHTPSGRHAAHRAHTKRTAYTPCTDQADNMQHICLLTTAPSPGQPAPSPDQADDMQHTVHTPSGRHAAHRAHTKRTTCSTPCTHQADDMLHTVHTPSRRHAAHRAQTRRTTCNTPCTDQADDMQHTVHTPSGRHAAHRAHTKRTTCSTPSTHQADDMRHTVHRPGAGVTTG